MRKLLNWIKKHYNNPEVVITENGVSDDEEHYGSLDDQQRVRFLTKYINNVLKGKHCVLSSLKCHVKSRMDEIDCPAVLPSFCCLGDCAHLVSSVIYIYLHVYPILHLNIVNQ